MRCTRNNFQIFFLCLGNEKLSYLIGHFKREGESWEAKCPFSFWINYYYPSVKLDKYTFLHAEQKFHVPRGFLTVSQCLCFLFLLISLNLQNGVKMFVTMTEKKREKRDKRFYPSLKAYCKSLPKLFGSLIKQMKNKNMQICYV